jgi:uncharacterized membrane protein
MSNLVVVGFDEPHKAEEARLKLQELQSENLLDIADVVVAVKDRNGKIKLHHEGNLISDPAVFQGFCGSLANLIVVNATAGTASGALTDGGDQRSLHERVDRNADSQQFSAFRLNQKSHPGQGPAAGRA